MTAIAELPGPRGRPEKVAHFDPDRRRDRDSNPVFLAFGGGPRFCPRRNLAFLEGKAAPAMLARNFEWEPAGRRRASTSGSR